MGFLQNLKTLKDRVTGQAENSAREHTFKEAASIFDFFMDTYGWDAMAGADSGMWPAKRTARSVANSISRNLAKYKRDGFVKRGINLHTDFTFGRGIDVPKCKSEAVQEIVSKFWKSAVNQRNFFGFIAQQRRHKETLLAGEINIMVKIDENTSQVKLYPINPPDIVEVIPDADEPTRPAFYLLKRNRKVWNFDRNEWEQSQDSPKELYRAMRYKLLEASDQELQRGLVYHIGLNEFFDFLRGDSDVDAVADAAESARDMADDGTALSRANAETAYKAKILKGGKTVKDAYLAYIRSKTDGSNPTGAPASDWIENDSMLREWMQARDTGANFREKDMRAQRAYIWAGLGFGEHYMGDPSSGNLATATAMELPVLKMIQAEQKFWASIYSDLVDFVIDIAAVTGTLAGEVVDQTELEIETTENRSFALNFPPITQKDIQQYMTALGTAVDKTLIPEETAARLAMELFEVEDIDEALDELFQAKEVEAELAKIRAQNAPPPPAPGQPKAPGAAAPAPPTGKSNGLPPGMESMQPMKGPAGVAGNGGGGKGNGNGNGNGNGGQAK